MFRYLLCIAVTIVVAVGAAWTMNQNAYGYRKAMFGPFDFEGSVTLDNLEEHVNLRSSDTVGSAVVEMLDDTDFDFGVMGPGEEGTKIFRVRNVGESNLTLRVGATTCKCTLGELEKSALGPGDETEITLTWKVKENSREFSQSAQIITNDPTSPAITLKIHGRVISDFEVVPEKWTFTDVATGESFEVSGEIYNYSGSAIEPGKLEFTSQDMTALAEFSVQRIPEDEIDELRKGAIEGFRVTAKVAAGMRQGAVSQNLLFGFHTIDGDGRSETDIQENPGEENAAIVAGKDEVDEDDAAEKPDSIIPIATKGRIVGPLSMLESSKLRGRAGGGYQYSFGRIPKDGSLTATAFVVLKGKERENTTLTVGEVSPKGMVQASFGAPKVRGSMVLYPLTIQLTPGDNPVDRLGKNQDDYGKVWIESDNPNVSKMGIVLTFGFEPR